MTTAAILLARVGRPLLFAALVAGVLTALLVRQQDFGVEASLTLTVPVPAVESVKTAVGRSESSVLDRIQAADLFAGALVGWLESPDFVAAVYARSEVVFSRPTSRRLSRVFSVRRAAGPVVGVRFTARTRAEAERMSAALVAVVAERARALGWVAGGEIFEVVPGEPLILDVERSPVFRGLVAAVVVVVVGVSTALLVDALREPRQEDVG